MTENLKTLSDSLQCHCQNVYAVYATAHSPVSSTFLYTYGTCSCPRSSGGWNML